MMAELGERLKDLDGDSLQKVLEAAGTLLSQSPAQPAADHTDPDAAQGSHPLPALPSAGAGDGRADAPAAGLNQLLDTLLGSSSADAAAGNTEARPPSGAANAWTSVLPQLLQAFSGKGNYIDENRLNLVKAIKPYMAEARAGSVDRAIKMANMAKAAQMALGLLGR